VHRRSSEGEGIQRILKVVLGEFHGWFVPMFNEREIKGFSRKGMVGPWFI